MTRSHSHTPPRGFDPARDLAPGFLDFYLPLHREFTPRQQAHAARRLEALAEARQGRLPDYLAPSPATSGEWSISLPPWCRDQRNLMSGPADDAVAVVRMLHSGSPGVLLDLEDTVADRWENLQAATDNVVAALQGELTASDERLEHPLAIEPSGAVVWCRVRGLHLGQSGVLPGREPTAAALFDLAQIAYRVEWERLRHPLAIYIPRSEAADEAAWWRDAFRAVARARGWPDDAIKCMALVESHPLAYQMEEFLYHLRDHILGLNLGRWDYLASLAQYMLHDPDWVLPDRDTLPADAPFYQRVRLLMADICHRRGALAIGDMTTLYPSAENAELNARALQVLELDKRGEAGCAIDGSWTGHPDQNAIALAQFPAPNQIHQRPAATERHPDLRPVPRDIGQRTADGTRIAARTLIRYRNGLIHGKGASVLDGAMEDLSADRLCRTMIAQRIRHRGKVAIFNPNGRDAPHSKEYVRRVFDEALERLIVQLPRGADPGSPESLREARRESERLVHGDWPLAA